ncbi:MAG: hypothetical protein EOP10_35275, partial [Proteobacteria bacterium]
PKGYMHFPESYDQHYFEMLTAEQLRIIEGANEDRLGWVKIRKRNEALDCRVYARAMANLAGHDSKSPKHWRELDEKITRYRRKRDKNYGMDNEGTRKTSARI